MDNNIKQKVSKRELTRLVAIMAHYLLQQNDNTKEEVINHLFETPVLQEELDINISNVDKVFLNELINGSIDNKDVISNIINSNIKNHKINMNISDQLIFSILHLGVFELMSKLLDKKIIVSQYVNLSSDFFNKQEISIINAILDSINIV